MTVEVTSADGIAHIQLRRPEVLNAVDLGLLTGLSDALDKAEAQHPRALVLSGAGRAFSAGGDINASREIAADPVNGPRKHAEMLHRIGVIVTRIDQFPCLTIAAIEGPAVGGAIGIAMAADLRVMGTSARLIPGWVKMSASPDGGASYFLAQHIGGRAMRAWLLSGRPLSAQAAAGLLLADEVCEDGRAVETAFSLARTHQDTAPNVVAHVRRLAAAAAGNDLAAQLELEGELLSQLRSSAERRDALQSWSSGNGHGQQHPSGPEARRSHETGPGSEQS